MNKLARLFVIVCLLGSGPAHAEPAVELVEKYYKCMSMLAWATPMSGDHMTRRNNFQKATVAGQPVYVLSDSTYPPTFEDRAYLFGPAGAISTNLREAPQEQSESRYLPLTHQYLSLSVPGVPATIVGDVGVSRAYGGIDTFFTALDRGSTEGQDFATKHAAFTAKPLKTRPVPSDEAIGAMKNEALQALAEVSKTSLASLERGSPAEYQSQPYRKNVFDRFKEALQACSAIGDAEIQGAITDAQTRVAAEYTVYLQRYPAKKLTTFDSVCKFFGLTD